MQVKSKTQAPLMERLRLVETLGQPRLRTCLSMRDRLYRCVVIVLTHFLYNVLNNATCELYKMRIFNYVMEKICAILFYCYLFLSNLDLTRKAPLRLQISFSRAFWQDRQCQPKFQITERQEQQYLTIQRI